MPNIRRNLHFKLDASCHHEASPRRLGCRRLAKTPPDADFQKLATPPLLKNQPSVHSSILLTFFPPFESTFQFPSRKFPIFLCYISSWRPLNYEHHSFSPQFLVFQLLLPFLFLVSSDLKWLRYWISFCSSLIGLLK